jgi:hypothetical protein
MTIESLHTQSDGSVRVNLTQTTILADNPAPLGDPVCVVFSISGNTMTYTYCDASWSPLADATEILTRQ